MHEDTFYGKITNCKNEGKLKIRTLLDESFNEDKITEKVYNKSIKRILLNHLNQEVYNNVFDEKGKLIKPCTLAFSIDGIDEMNKNIIKLNNNKFHNKIYKVKIIHEKGKKFSVKTILNKQTKYAKSATGTNLFFCIYENKEKGKSYHTPSFEELIKIQKQEAQIKQKDKYNVPKFIFDKKKKKYDLKFYLQPNDLVYIPTDEEKDNPNLVNLDNLNKSQVDRIYKFTDGSGTTANFIPAHISKVIFNFKKTEQTKRKVSFTIQNEFGVGSPQSKNQKSTDGIMIKENCWKLKINRLGKIIKVQL